MKRFLSSFLWISFFAPSMLQAAACCGSNNLFPSLISGDERRQLTATVSHSNVVGDADTSGAWVGRSAGDAETRSSVRVDFANLISDRWQLGASVPVIRRARSRNGSEADSMGLGDVGVVLGFEALPNWSYSAWRPKGVVFASLTLPTGRSALDSTALYQVDATGRGYWTLAAGALFQKTWGSWDSMWLAEAHQPFQRSLSTPAGNFQMTPAWGASTALGVGWNSGDFRVGGLISLAYEGPVRTQGLIDETGAPTLLVPLTLQISYLVSDNWSLGGLYSDSTFLAANNAPVARSASLVVQTRWDR